MGRCMGGGERLWVLAGGAGGEKETPTVRAQLEGRIYEIPNTVREGV